MIYDSSNLILDHLGTIEASYAPKDIHVQAIQVTRDNIGKLALEFEAELFYGETAGLPYFLFEAKRFDDSQPDGQHPPVNLRPRLGDWIVALWGELHIYQDVDFQNTFTIDTPNEDGRHELTPGTFASVRVAE